EPASAVLLPGLIQWRCSPSLSPLVPRGERESSRAMVVVSRSCAPLDSPRLTRYKCAVQRRWSWLVLVLLISAGILVGWRYYHWRDHRFDAVILAAARRYGVEPALVKAVVWRESWFNPEARGSRQELGLMQIRGAAAQEWAQSEKLKTFSPRSEEHTSELQSLAYLVCRLLLEK